MTRVEMKLIHGQLVPVTILPPEQREEVNFIPVFSRTGGRGGKV